MPYCVIVVGGSVTWCLSQTDCQLEIVWRAPRSLPEKPCLGRREIDQPSRCEHPVQHYPHLAVLLTLGSTTHSWQHYPHLAALLTVGSTTHTWQYYSHLAALPAHGSTTHTCQHYSHMAAIPTPVSAQPQPRRATHNTRSWLMEARNLRQHRIVQWPGGSESQAPLRPAHCIDSSRNRALGHPLTTAHNSQHSPSDNTQLWPYNVDP